YLPLGLSKTEHVCIAVVMVWRPSDAAHIDSPGLARRGWLNRHSRRAAPPRVVLARKLPPRRVYAANPCLHGKETRVGMLGPLAGGRGAARPDALGPATRAHRHDHLSG